MPDENVSIANAAELPKIIAVKAVGDWEIEVLGNRFGSETDKDSDGQYFSPNTNLHNDRFPNPLVHYYHGHDPEGNPQGDPEIIGEVKGIDRRGDGVWYRILLDKASEWAGRVWQGAKDGIARASSGSINYLTRDNERGEILNWPVVEMSIFDAIGKRQPADKYAVALPVMKSSYKRAGVVLPELPEALLPPTNTLETPQGDTEEITMDEKELQEQINKQVVDALKADKEQREAEEAAIQAEAERTAEAVKAEKVKWEAEAVKANRLPGGGDPVEVPAYLKHSDTQKYDNMSPGEHAFFVQTYEGLRRKNGGDPLPDAAIKGLAMKMEAEAEKGDQHSADAMKAMRQKVDPAIKAYEINYSTYSAYGDQWVGVLYHSDLWEKIRGEAWVMGELESKGDVRQIPDGFESDVVPLESADPTWYNVAQQTAYDATSGRPVATITSSNIGTAQKAVALAKVGCRVLFTGELEEDSLIRWVPNAYRQIQTSGAQNLDFLCIDGDTETGASTSINDIGGTPTTGDLFLAVDGFRKLALVTNTANSRDGGSLTVDDYLDTVKLMGNAGIGGADPTKVTFIVDPHTYWKSLTLEEVKTRDVFGNPTIENGMLTGLWGYPLKRSYFMHYAGVLLASVTTAAYMNLAYTDGKVDQTTEGNNTKGAILAVRWDQWALRWKRRMTLEVSRYPESDTNQIVAMLRFGLGYRDTDASAISYNLTV